MVGLFSIIIIFIYTLQAEIEHYSHINIFFHDIGLVIISILIIQLNNRTQRVERAEKQLEIFINIIAHDLMQPVTLIKLYKNMVAKLSDNKVHHLLQNLSGATDTLEYFISDLKDTA